MKVVSFFIINPEKTSMKTSSKIKYIAVTVALILFANILTDTVRAGSAVSTKIVISARVPERTSLKVLTQVQELVVTDADIARGYVEIYSGTRVQVSSNNTSGYLLAFEVMKGLDSISNSVIVLVGDREVQLSGSGGWIPQLYRRGGDIFDVTYRFLLSKNAQPGIYSWPIAISVLPLTR